MSDINKILDRVRKLLKLSENAGSEAEAASAAEQATRLMDQYALSEALVRLDDPSVKPEAIKEESLEPDKDLAHSKRVAWKETIALALGESLGVKVFWTNQYHGGRKRSDMRGFGRESAIQTWRYTCQYLWRQVDEFADEAFKTSGATSPKPWKNAFRVGCAARLAQRILASKEQEDKEIFARKADIIAQNLPEDRTALALTVVEKDRDEVKEAYKARSKGFGTISRIGSTSSFSGYRAGKEAGDRVSLGGGRAGLASGRGMITE